MKFSADVPRPGMDGPGGCLDRSAAAPEGPARSPVATDPEDRVRPWAEPIDSPAQVRSSPFPTGKRSFTG